MKILHITPHFWPFEGGLENLVFQIATHQARFHEVSVLTVSHESSLPTEEERNGVRIIRTSGKNLFSLGYFAPQKDFCNIIAETNPDILFTHTRFFLTSFVAGKFFHTNFPNRQWIHVEHGQNPVISHQSVVRWGARMVDASLGKWIFSHADTLVAVSETGKHFIQRFALKDVHVIPTGVVIPPRIEPMPRRNKGLFVGRMVREKGIQEILQVAAKSLQWDFELVGEGPLFHSKILPNVRWTGRVPHQNVASYIQSSDMVILPSWSESVSMSVLESCAQGRAVLATDVGENKNILSEKFLFPSRQITVLKNKLDFFSNKFNLLSQEGEKNYKYVQTHHSRDAMLAAYDTLLMP